MNTTRINGTVFYHNGGFDGDVKIQDFYSGKVIEIPFEDIKGFVAEYVRQERQIRLEDLDPDEILFT